MRVSGWDLKNFSDWKFAQRSPDNLAPYGIEANDVENNCSAAKYTASNDTTTNDTASNDTASNDTASNDTASNDTASNDTASNDTASNQSANDHGDLSHADPSQVVNEYRFRPGNPGSELNREAGALLSTGEWNERLGLGEGHSAGEDAATAELIQRFYDPLTTQYHLIFEDWRRSVAQQGAVLAAVIAAEQARAPLSVLDCSCGIGTQTIGLALQGFSVHGTDLSGAAVQRARSEAASFGVHASFGIADLRELHREVPGEFDVVISCDNALPHLLSERDLVRAAQGMAAKVRAGGLLLVSIRDYTDALETRPRFQNPRAFDDAEGRRLVFQVWDWLPDGRTYTVNQVILRRVNGEWSTSQFAGKYRALTRAELSEVFRAAGLEQISWLSPEESGYYQPILLARKPR